MNDVPGHGLTGGGSTGVALDSANLDLLYNVISSLPVAVYTTDADGMITSYNQAAVELWGREPQLGAERWCGSFRIYNPDGTPLPHDQCPMAQAIKENRSVRGVEAIAERPDGTRVTFRPHPTPLRAACGALVGAVNMLVDMSERRSAARVAERLASIVESSDDAIISKDMNGIIATWNSGAERMFGYTAAEAIGRPVLMLIPEDRQSEETQVIARIKAGERVEHYETIRRGRDGSLVDVSLTVSPIKDADGNIVGASKIARDLTKRRRAEARQKILLDEVNHRVKNTLATVQAIASQMFRSEGSPEGAREAFEGRLMALSRAHDHLSREYWEAVDIASIVGNIAAAHRSSNAERIRFGGDTIRVAPQTAVILSMALHELATNAAKYGALSRECGVVDVRWSVETGANTRRMQMTWQEAGGPPVVHPEQTGFGTRLVDRAVRQELNGTVEIAYDSGGLRCRVEIPLPPS